MRPFAGIMLAAALAAGHAQAQEQRYIGYAEVLSLAINVSPAMRVARAEEHVIASEVGIAGVIANPTFIGGTSTQTAKVSVGVSVPLVILGQRGAAIRASQAGLDAAHVGTEAIQSDSRAAAAHAFVALWLAERIAQARAKAEELVAQLDQAVSVRVQLGGAPEVDRIRSNALKLRAHAEAVQAAQLVRAAAADLGRWIGESDASELRTSDAAVIPDLPPPLSALLGRIAQGPAVTREKAAAHAAHARADRERALVRPALTLDLGIDARDPTLPATNYRAQLGVELPVFTQRAPYIQREDRAAAAAEQRSRYQMSTLNSDLVVAYRTFEAATAGRITLEQAGVPAARTAAKSTEESYALGRASLEAVLDADRTLIDVELTLLDVSAVRANAWIDVEHAMGVK